jgi:hypothetical protein
MTGLRAFTHRTVITAALLTVAVLAPSTAADAATAEPPAGAAITRIDSNGTGCKTPGSVTTEWTDATGFRVHYADMVARAGGGAPGSDLRKNCLLSVQLTIPAGYTVALESAATRKYATLAAGARATATTKTYWQGRPDTVSWSEVRRGPTDDYWQSDHVIGPDAQQFAYCGLNRLLNINQELVVLRGGDPAAESSAEFGPDTPVNASYQLVWKRCLF